MASMFIALREMRRAKVRFALLGGAVGLLVFVLLFFQSVAGALIGALTGALENGSADVIVYGDRAQQSVEASVVPAAAVAEVTEVDGVAEAVPVGEGTFTVRASGDLTDAVVFGVPPGELGYPTTLVEGRLPRSDGEAVASTAADEVGFGIGDVVTVEPGGIDIEIVGLADSARFAALATLTTTFATYEDAVRGLDPGSGSLPPSLIAVAVAEGEDAETVAARITERVDGVEALDRDTAVASLPGIGTIGQSFGILYFLLFIVVALVTGVFFLILTVQKRDALVLLRAVGARRRDIVWPVLIQVVAVVGVGIVVGSALAALSVGAAGEGLDASLSLRTVGVSGIAILVLGLVAAAGAIRRVLAIEPAEATGAAGML
jgi:putative ABC transport system permease protein